MDAGWKSFSQRYDRHGQSRGLGRILHGVVANLVRAPFFRQKPPRQAGREELAANRWPISSALPRRAKPDVVQRLRL